ncbi:HlyD family efflux transporter periplasmic adaptor subunit [Planctomicrobium piriforme]|uniref:Putative peptide zinc metalloprotease protein n=1 Tax=Planctomicrobium piriforme TaxID=1576369 RepID=A0A1I3G587_9PLAN|nr:HlyD family efflux transporter periplasmic adaptor subunit [Planctomicrobium piriforme]SFI18650.1 putative peptide zinc metalloprotease protein [Planctomicrobium piriforme]
MQQQQATNAAIIPSTQRPLPLRCRADLVVEQILYQDVAYPVIKDPIGLKYYRLQPEQFGILSLLDGQRSLEDLRDDLQAQFPTTHITPADVQSLVTDLHEKGLLISDRLGQGQSALKRHRQEQLKKLRQTLMNPLYLRLPGWDPDATLKKLNPWCGWLFDWPAILVCMLFVATSWLFVAVRFDEIRQRLPEFQQFFGWPNLIFLWITMAATKILHEFGHGLSCKRYGGECHSMGIMLLVFSPTLYCDVTDSWMMKNKWHRIIIGAAGMYIEMILAAFAILFWYGSQPGLLNNLALNVFFISTVTTVIFNANPLLKYDGYYILSDYLEIPNLTSKASKMLSQTFAWTVFGIDMPTDPFMPTSGKGWFILYAIASAIYRWVVLFGITLFLYTVLKPYRLQSLGIAMAVFSVCGVIFGLFYQLFQMLSAPRIDPMSRVRVAVAIVLLGGLVTGVLMLPVPWYEEAAFYLEPVNVHHVYSSTPGFLDQIHVAPDQTVQPGQPLLTLESPELSDKIDELTEQRSAQAVEPQLYRALKDPDSQLLAERRLETMDQEISDLQLQHQQTRVVAPIAGKVIAPPRLPVPTIDQTRRQLPTWHGTPLEHENLRAYLDEGTHLCSIAPEDDYQAILLIQQSDRGDLKPGDHVRLKLDLFPNQTITGVITDFSDRDLEYAPASLSNKYGGPLATVTDAQGREKLNNRVYQATVKLDVPPEALRTGMRGRMRFIVSERTLYDWLWRWFRQTFHFHL